MKKLSKILIRGFLALVLAVASVFGLAHFKFQRQRASTLTVDVRAFPIPSDPASVAEGKRLAAVRGCLDCHGPDLGGFKLVEDPALGMLAGSNLTRGRGSQTSGYTDADWIRAIRYGVSKAGHPLLFMPSDEFNSMSDEDLGQLIAYLKNVAPVDRDLGRSQAGPVMKVLYLFGQFPQAFPAERIDFQAASLAKVEKRPDAAYGKYLAAGCTGCHGPGYSGGAIPGVPPEWPKASNLTASGRVAGWSFAQFETLLREGKTPEGRQINPTYMPWKGMAQMTDTEVRALYEFVKTLPAKEPYTR